LKQLRARVLQELLLKKLLRNASAALTYCAGNRVLVLLENSRDDGEVAAREMHCDIEGGGDGVRRVLQRGVHVDVTQTCSRLLSGNLGADDEELPFALVDAPLHATSFRLTRDIKGGVQLPSSALQPEQLRKPIHSKRRLQSRQRRLRACS
jgi:hypothetical protein